MSNVSGFYSQYIRLSVPYPRQIFGADQPGEWKGIYGSLSEAVFRISQYQNTGSTDPKHATPSNIDKTKIIEVREMYSKYADSGPKGGMAGLNPIPAFVDVPDEPRQDIIDWVIANVFLGKGSPQSIRFVLQLVIWSKYRNLAGGLRWSSESAMKADLQPYVDKIGLDCNGFVVNCINALNSKHWGAMTVQNIGTADNRLRANPRGDVSKIVPGDVISYAQNEQGQNVSHVAMVDEPLATSNGARGLIITESISHAGLRKSGPAEVIVKNGKLTGTSPLGAALFELKRSDFPPTLDVVTNPALVYISGA